MISLNGETTRKQNSILKVYFAPPGHRHLGIEQKVIKITKIQKKGWIKIRGKSFNAKVASIWLKRLTVSGILIKASNTQKSTKIRAKKCRLRLFLRYIYLHASPSVIEKQRVVNTDQKHFWLNIWWIYMKRKNYNHQWISFQSGFIINFMKIRSKKYK